MILIYKSFESINKIIFVIIGIFVSCIICTGANAPRIDTIYLDNQDLSARTKPVMDLNDNPTALLKVSIPRYPDATIVGNMVIEVKPLENAIYWVYVAAGAKKIEVQHVDWGAFEVPLRNIEAKNTYVVKLSVPEPVKLQTADVKFIVTPRDAKIRIDGSIKNPTTDGYITLDVGKHQVRISADGYSDSYEKNWIVSERTTEYKCDLDRLSLPTTSQGTTYNRSSSGVRTTTMSTRQSGYSTSRSTATTSQSRAGSTTVRSTSTGSRSSAAPARSSNAYSGSRSSSPMRSPGYNTGSRSTSRTSTSSSSAGRRSTGSSGTTNRSSGATRSSGTTRR